MRLAARIAAAAIGILLLLVIAVFAFLQTEAGGRAAARALAAIASTPGKMELRVGRIGPGLPFRVAISGVSLADGEGGWLAADRIEVRWRPLVLLGGRLSIAEAMASGVRLSRLPEGEAEAQAADEGFALPSLPFDLQVDRLALNDVEIGPAVAGEAVALQARGEIAAERDGQIRTDVEIVRTNGVGGAVRLAALWEPATKRLSLGLRADEPQGGLIGSLLDLAGRPAVRLTFTGDGPLTGWEGRLEGAVGEDIGIVSHLATEDAPDGVRLKISGRAQVAALLPEAARPVAPDGIGFAASVRRPETRVLAIDSAGLSAKGVELGASGVLVLDDERFDDVQLTLAVADGSALAPLLAPAGLQAGEARIRLSGPWASPTADISADLVDLRSADASIARSALQALVGVGDGQRIEVEADATFTGVRAGGMDVDAVLGAPPRLRLSSLIDQQDNKLSVDRVELLAPALNANGRGAYDLGLGEGHARINTAIPNLAAFADLSGLELAGSAALAIDARAAAGSLSAALGLASSGFRSGIPAADVLLGAAPSLRAALQADQATGHVRVGDVVLAGQGIRATAAGALQDGAVSAEYRLDIPDVTPVAKAAGVAATGALALDGMLSGPAADPNAKAVLMLSDGQVADAVASPIRIELDAESLVARPRGSLTATALAAGAPLRLAVPFARESDGVLRVGPIDGRGAGARLSGTVSLPYAGGAMLGAITLRTGGEGQPLALAGHRLGGEAEFRVVLGERNGKQTAEVDGTGSALALATPDGPLGSAESLSLRANLTGTADPHADVALTVGRPTMGGVALAGVDARLVGSPRSARYEITVQLVDDPAERIRIGGSFAQQNGGSQLTIALLDGQAAGHRLALRRPLTITQGGGETILADLDLVAGDGAITGSGRTGASGTEGRLLLSRLPLSLARALRPDLNITGSLDGEASVRTEGKDLAGRVNLNLSGVHSASTDQAPPLEANASATIGGGTAAIEIRVPLPGGSPLALGASVPVRIDARTLAVEISKQAPLRGRLTWSGAVARLWELAPLPEQRLTGEANVDLAVAGTVAAPEVGGEASLTNGRFEHFFTETIIEGLSLQARATGGGVIALALRGNDGAKGTIAGDGRITLAKGMAPLIELVVTFAEATLVRRDDVNATLSGVMTFRQDEAGTSLAGQITSDRMDIRLIDRLPPSVVVLDVTEINPPPGHEPTRAEPPPDTAAGPAVAFDIGVKLPRRVFVRGRGLESEWEGDLHVSGTTAGPRLVGIVAVRSGTFDFAGKRFTLEMGEIGFTGGASINPTLNVRATRSTPELTAVIRVTGTALEPEIELTSTPALPESEILSRVLFDKGVAKLGPVEAAQLAMALDALASGESMSEDALSYVRNLLGLDVLTIEPGGEEGEGPALGVGRYVAEGVYVGARQGVAEESTAGTVGIEVLPGLAIESEVSEGRQGPTGALGLRWKWDY